MLKVPVKMLQRFIATEWRQVWHLEVQTCVIFTRVAFTKHGVIGILIHTQHLLDDERTF